MLEMTETKPLSRVRIWNGTTPWLDHRPRGRAHPVRRLPGERRRPDRGLPALERAHARHGEQTAAVGLHLRCRGAHAVSPDVVQALHLPAGGGVAAGDPGGHRRVHRRDPGRPAAGRHGRQARTAGADPGDQRHARRAVRGPRVLPGTRQRRPGPLRRGRRHAEGRDEPAPVPDQPGRGEAGQPGRGRGVRPGRAGHRRRDQRQGSRPARHRPADRRPRDDGQHDRHRHLRTAGEPRTGCTAAGFRRPEVHRERGRRADALSVDHPERAAAGGHRRHRDRRRDHPCGRGHHHRPGPGQLGRRCLPRTRQARLHPRRRTSNSASATAGTSASVSSWRAPSCRSCSTRCCAASRR